MWYNQRYDQRRKSKQSVLTNPDNFTNISEISRKHPGPGNEVMALSQNTEMKVKLGKRDLVPGAIGYLENVIQPRKPENASLGTNASINPKTQLMWQKNYLSRDDVISSNNFFFRFFE